MMTNTASFKSSSNGKIFVVDDSMTIRELVAHLVRTTGFEAVTFDSAGACLAALKAERPVLVLMDFHMEVMRGDQACAQIKTMSGPAIPVILMTSEGATSEVMDSVKAGADDFLPKPIRKAQLESKLAAIRTAYSAELKPSERRARQRLLLVEPDESYRRLLGGVLETAGYQLMYAARALEAVPMLDRSADKIDALIVNLDGIGPDFVQHVRSKPATKDKLVIGLSRKSQTTQWIDELKRLTGGAIIDAEKHPVEAVTSLINARLHRLTLDMRASQRVPYYALVEFRQRGKSQTEWLSGFSHDVSSGGVFIRTLTPLPQGGDVELKLHLQGKLPLLCGGMVAWSNGPQYQERGFSCRIGMGIKFTPLEPEQKQLIQQLLKAPQ
jgi:two-component system, cell cycle response regulator